MPDLKIAGGDQTINKGDVIQMGNGKLFKVVSKDSATELTFKPYRSWTWLLLSPPLMATAFALIIWLLSKYFSGGISR